MLDVITEVREGLRRHPTVLLLRKRRFDLPDEQVMLVVLPLWFISKNTIKVCCFCTSPDTVLIREII